MEGEGFHSAKWDANNVTHAGNCRVYYLVIRVCLGGLLSLAGIIGNILTILIMNRTTRPSATTRALLLLALTDLTVVVIYGTMAVSIPVLNAIHKAELAHTLQLHFLVYLLPFGQMASLICVFITVVVTRQRHLSVCHPHQLRTKNQIRAVYIRIAFASVFSVIFHIPMFFQDRIDGHVLVRRDFANSKAYTVFYAIVAVQLFRYVLPVSALIFMTTGLIRALRKQSRTKDAALRRNSGRAGLTMSLVVVVLVFIVCQSFAPARQILMWTHRPYSEAILCGASLFYFGPLDLISLLVNSSSNFIVFVLCAKGFRRILIAMLTKRTTNGSHSTLPRADAYSLE
ncbi:hypothetical protein CAPTEDRAFT_197225 [Capitella teleta]|uniref:G-protein coupled receptors family 1 profile domain-containing protein n=1 Tax=Capitella teleta TaxID=283909 RepID=R7T842_CAPTE|nr:hypothetical protein CAPTEDRAFT_197225 [Capitella teleta]|eukprot:ELT89770.1 hypothetical protein CAPTEDRAFT_197225 [Capitella teleta]